MVQVRFQPTIWVNERLEIAGLFRLVTSQHSAKRTKVLAPSPARCRKMLCEVREHLRIPVEALAALLGLPLATLRKWFEGKRSPSGSGRRLIWLMHSSFFHPAALRNLDSWLGWEESPEKVANVLDQDQNEAVCSLDSGHPSRNQIVRNGSGCIKVRNIRNVEQLGQYLSQDIRYVGITLLVQASVKVSESIADCDARIADNCLDIKTKLRFMDLKIGLINQQLSIAHEMLELKRELARNPPVFCKTRRRRRSFSPGEKVVPLANPHGTFEENAQGAS
ncbi:MAG: hypothetical protein O2960_27905 [Verrucomicrobia bacterium]|nr:hypothetical protein [Verrucomicrobiota bacterium]